MASDKELKNQEEINKLRKENARLSRQDVANSDDFSSLLRDNLKNLKLVQAAKSEILSIDRRITKEVNDAFGFEKKNLGTTKFNTDLAKQRLQLERDIRVLQQKRGSELTTDKELQSQINRTINQRIKSAKEVLKINKLNAEASKKISDNLSVRTFAGLKDVAGKIGLGDFAQELGDAAQAARDAASQNIDAGFSSGGGASGFMNSMFGKDMGSKAISDKFAGISDADKSILEKAMNPVNAAGDPTKKGLGKGLTSDFMDRVGLKGMGTGAGAANKIKGMGGIGGLQKALKPISPLLKGLKALAPALKKLLGPLAILMEIAALDSQTADMAKNTNITYKEAQKLRGEMQSIAMSSGENFVSGKKLTESFVELNKELGTSGTKLDGELLTTMTQLREMAGFTNEEMMGLAKLSLTTDDNMQDITGEFMASAKAAGIQNGVMVNTKTLSKDLSKLSAATTLSLGKNPKLLGEALAVTKALGMEMAQLEGIASGLMNFEESIKNELEAELLLGKNINLEKARQAALNNDLSTLASEIAEQAGTAAEFGEMNRIQQEAIAKAVGMGREDLAQTLYVQEQLAGSTGEQAAEEEKLLNARIAEVGLAQAQKEMAAEGFEGLKKQVGMADRMTAAMDKLNEVVVTLVEALMPILDIFISIFDIIGPIMKLLNPFIQFAATGFLAIADVLTGITGGGFGMERTKASVKRTEDASVAVFGTSMDIYDRYDDQGQLKMAKGGIVTGPTRAIVGEAGPEAVIPLDNQKGINVDNSKMESLLGNIDKHLAGLNNGPVFTINRG